GRPAGRHTDAPRAVPTLRRRSHGTQEQLATDEHPVARRCTGTLLGTGTGLRVPRWLPRRNVYRVARVDCGRGTARIHSRVRGWGLTDPTPRHMLLPPPAPHDTRRRSGWNRVPAGPPAGVMCSTVLIGWLQPCTLSSGREQPVHGL